MAHNGKKRGRGDVALCAIVDRRKGISADLSNGLLLDVRDHHLGLLDLVFFLEFLLLGLSALKGSSSGLGFELPVVSGFYEFSRHLLRGLRGCFPMGWGHLCHIRHRWSSSNYTLRNKFGAKMERQIGHKISYNKLIRMGNWSIGKKFSQHRKLANTCAHFGHNSSLNVFGLWIIFALFFAFILRLEGVGIIAQIVRSCSRAKNGGWTCPRMTDLGPDTNFSIFGAPFFAAVFHAKGAKVN